MIAILTAKVLASLLFSLVGAWSFKEAHNEREAGHLFISGMWVFLGVVQAIYFAGLWT